MKKVMLSLMLVFIFSLLIAQPETSSWDGVSYCIKEYLKENLNDPKSLKIKDAYKVTLIGGDYIQRVTYRAKNAFGALILQDNVFFMKRVYGKTYKYEVYGVLSSTEFKAMIDLQNYSHQ